MHELIKKQIEIIQLDIDILLARIERSTDDDMKEVFEKHLLRLEVELQNYKVKYPEYFI